LLGLLGEVGGGGENVAGGVAGFIGRRADAADIGGDLLGRLRGLRHIARDLGGGRALLLDRRADRGGDLADLLDGRGDAVDRLDRLLGGALDLRDAGADLLGGVRGLACQALDLRRTTAKPLPASPARAASMVALSASRLVCSAMLEISSATCSICWAPSASARTIPSVRRALSTARAVIAVDCATWRLISLIEVDNSSAAEATVWTRVEASVAAELTTEAR